MYTMIVGSLRGRVQTELPTPLLERSSRPVDACIWDWVVLNLLQPVEATGPASQHHVRVAVVIRGAHVWVVAEGNCSSHHEKRMLPEHEQPWVGSPCCATISELEAPQLHPNVESAPAPQFLAQVPGGRIAFAA